LFVESQYRTRRPFDHVVPQKDGDEFIADELIDIAPYFFTMAVWRLRIELSIATTRSGSTFSEKEVKPRTSEKKR